MNGTAHWSSQIFQPRQHGSGAAPLADLLTRKHHGATRRMQPAERDLLLAWMDSNGLYYGAWDYSEHGCANTAWQPTKQALVAEMKAAGCVRCHGQSNQITFFENDWFNLRDPALSRLLRAPLARGAEGFGLGLCRDRKVNPKRQRIHLLRDGYAHAIQPVEKFPRQPIHLPDSTGRPVVSFASTQDAHYQKMLAIIREGREKALAAPRVDMPGAEVIAGACRQFKPLPLPDTAPALTARLDQDGVVQLTWERSARTIGLEAELHRSNQRDFTPSAETLLAQTRLAEYADKSAAEGRQHYALVLASGPERSLPTYASLVVPRPTPPPPPTSLQATPASCSVRLRWQAPADRRLSYHVYRRAPGTTHWQRLTDKPIRWTSYTDCGLEADTPHAYVVRAVNLRDLESKPTAPVTATAMVIREPVFATVTEPEAQGLLYDGDTLPGQKHGKARSAGGRLDFQDGGHFTFAHRREFDLGQPLSVECWVWLDQLGKSPVLASCGRWREAGWFLQRLGARWRWHVGGVDCDGGQPATNRWVHLAGTFDGKTLRLFEDGVQVAETSGGVKLDPFPGDLHVGQYSGGPSDDFQVRGRLLGVKVYHRPLPATEVAELSRSRPAQP
jgi:hypothetical protein